MQPFSDVRFASFCAGRSRHSSSVCKHSCLCRTFPQLSLCSNPKRRSGLGRGQPPPSHDTRPLRQLLEYRAGSNNPYSSGALRFYSGPLGRRLWPRTMKTPPVRDKRLLSRQGRPLHHCRGYRSPSLSCASVCAMTPCERRSYPLVVTQRGYVNPTRRTCLSSQHVSSPPQTRCCNCRFSGLST